MASCVLAPALTLCASITQGALASSAMVATATTSLQSRGLRFFIFGVSSQINQVGRARRAKVCGLNLGKSRHRRVTLMLPAMSQKTRILQDIIPREIRHFPSTRIRDIGRNTPAKPALLGFSSRPDE